MSDLSFEKAIDPSQYDKIEWGSKEGKPSPIRNFFIEILRKELGGHQYNSVLDIGSGIGHMFDLYKKLGFKRIVGVEPSQRNIDISKSLHSDIQVVKASFQDFKSDEKFNVATAIMVVLHLPELNSVIQKVYSLLEESGLFLIIDADVDYETKPKWGWSIEIEKQQDGNYLVSSERKYGKITSIVRPVEHFIKAAKKDSFKIVKQEPLFASDELIKEAPYYTEIRNLPLAQLFVFQK